MNRLSFHTATRDIVAAGSGLMWPGMGWAGNTGFNAGEETLAAGLRTGSVECRVYAVGETDKSAYPRQVCRP